MDSNHIDILVMGVGAVGKTTFIHRFLGLKIPEKHEVTIHQGYSTNLTFNDTSYSVTIRDMAGQASLEYINRLAIEEKNMVDFSTNSTIILTLCDLTVRSSLQAIKDRIMPLVAQVHSAKGLKYRPKTNTFLIGNKLDLFDPNNPNHIKMKELEAFGLGRPYRVSALKSDKEVLDILTDIIHRFLETSRTKKKRTKFLCV